MLIALLVVALISVLLMALSNVVLPLRSLLLRDRRCPRCGAIDSLARSPRRKLDRIVSRMINCRRYKCHACRWKGLLREDVAAPSGTTTAPSTAELPVLREMQKA